MEGTYDSRDGNLPYHLIYLRAIQNFEVAQWNPFIFCGNTLFSNATYSFFYPVNWFMWTFPESSLPAMTTVVLIVDFFFAAYFMRMFLREVVRDEFWSLCGSLAYVLSWSSMQMLVGYPDHYTMFIYTPALLYLLMTFRDRGLLPNFILLTAVSALLLLGGSVQFDFYALVFTLCFAFFKGLEKSEAEGRRNLTIFVTMAVSVLFALMISAVKFVPFYISNRANTALFASSDDLTGYPPETLINMVLPGFFPGEVFLSYSGVFAFFFGLYAIAFIWNRSAFFWKTVAVLITLIVLGTPLVHLHYYLTGRSNLVFVRLAMFLPTCFAVLLSVAGKEILEDEGHCRRFMRFSVAVVASVFITALALRHRIPAEHAQYMTGIEIYSFSIMAVLVGLFFFLGASKSTGRALIFRIIFIVVMMADLMVFAAMYIKNANKESPPFIPAPYYKSLPHEREIVELFEKSNKNFRILGFSQGTSHSRNVGLSIYSSSGYESVPPSYITALYAYPRLISRDIPVYRHVGPHISPFGEGLLELTATRYIIYGDSVSEIPSSLPRYSLYNDYRVVRDDNEAIETVLGMREEFNIHTKVVLDSIPDIDVPEHGENGSARVIKEGSNDILFEVSSGENAVFLLNDTYDSGWKAYIDGNETKVMRANYAFRAVTVPAGVHKVFFSFTQKGFREGRMISIVSVLVFLLLAGFYLYSRLSKKVDSAGRVA